MAVNEIPLSSAIASSTLWITSRYATVQGARGREYEVFTNDGQALLAARSTVWGREIVVRDRFGEPVIRLLRSRAFILNGRADVLSARGRLGAVFRSGRFRDASGRRIARFRDARSFGSRAGEGMLQAVVDAALGADGTSQLSGPAAFVCTSESGPVASLSRRRLPFRTGDPVPPTERARALAGLLPRGLARWLLDRGTLHGWALERVAPVDGDPLLLLGAALFTIELSHW
jgi:hypothetical protein